MVTRDSGMFRFEDGRWTPYGPEDGLPATDRGHQYLFQDAFGNVMLNALDGIFEYDGAAWSLLVPAEYLPDEYVHDAVRTDDGVVWIATYSEIIRYDAGETTVFTGEDGFENGIRKVAVDTDGAVWVGKTFGKEAGLYRYDGTAWTSYSADDGLPSNTVFDLVPGEDGGLWIATDKGLCRYDGRQFATYTAPNEIAGNWPVSVAKQDEYIWTATNGGVSRFDGSVWANFTTRDGLPGVSAHAVLTDDTGVVWAATEGGLARFDGSTWETVLEADCRCLASGVEDDLWVGTDGDGVYRIVGDEIIRLAHVEGYEITCTDIAPDGTVWVGTEDAGVYRYAGGTWTNFMKFDGLMTNHIVSLESGDNGDVWAGQYLEGVIYFDGASWGEENIMKDDTVFDIFRDDRSRFWYGSYRGLTLRDGDTLTSAFEDQGLNVNYVRAILIDDGVLWLGTSFGLWTIPVADLAMEPTAVEREERAPEEFTLNGVYPNPFNPATTISFTVGAPGRCTVSVYNSAGQLVRELLSAHLTAGQHALVWDGRDDDGAMVSSGLYLVRVGYGAHAVTAKMTLVK